MNALTLLSELDYQAKRDLYRNIPEHAIPRTRFSDKTANGLTRCILQFLQLKGYWATRINTTGRFIQGQEFTDILGHRKQMKGTWIPGSTRKGTADIHSIIQGRHVSIEVKVGKDRMSEAQHKTKAAIELSGGIYWIVKSLEDFMSKYNELINYKQ